MTCNHILLRKTILHPLRQMPVWECIDCGKIFDIEEITEEERNNRTRTTI